MPLILRQHPTHFPELDVIYTGAMPGNRLAIGTRAYVPGITHGRLANVCSIPIVNTAATGWHLTPHGNSDERGALIRFPRYAYVVPDLTVDTSLLMVSAATAYETRAVRGMRAIVGAPFYQTQSFAGSTSVGNDPTDLTMASMIWFMRTAALDDTKDFQGGDLFIGSVAWSVPVFIESQNGTYTPPDPEPAYVTDVPPGCTVLETLNTQYTDFGTVFRGQLRLILSGNTQAQAQAIADLVVPRFRRFHQRYYYIDGPIGGPGIQSNAAGSYSYLTTTVGNLLAATVGTGPFDAVEVTSLEAAGAQAIADADIFFS